MLRYLDLIYGLRGKHSIRENVLLSHIKCITNNLWFFVLLSSVAVAIYTIICLFCFDLFKSIFTSLNWRIFDGFWNRSESVYRIDYE